MTLRECPEPSGDTIFSSNWMPLTTSTLNWSSLSSEPPISILIESLEGGSKIPGISSISLITLMVAEPVFSTVIVASTSEPMNDLILDLSYFFRISASRTVSFCSLRLTSPLEIADARGRIEYERVGNVNLGWSSDFTVLTIESQLPSGGRSTLKSDASSIGSSLPANTTVISESVTTNEDLFSKTNLLCQMPGLSSS